MTTMTRKWIGFVGLLAFTATAGVASGVLSADNGYGVPLARTTLGQNIRFAQVMEEHGFCWGGRWRGRGVDAMHFQAGSPS